MNPQMQARCDAVCIKGAEELKVSKETMQYFINSVLIQVKLLVFAENVRDADKKINVKETMQGIIKEIYALNIAACQLLPEPIDGKKAIELNNWTHKEMTPIIKFFFFGIKEEDRKDAEGKIIVPN